MSYFDCFAVIKIVNNKKEEECPQKVAVYVSDVLTQPLPLPTVNLKNIYKSEKLQTIIVPCRYTNLCH